MNRKQFAYAEKQIRERERRDYRRFFAIVMAIISLLVIGALTSCSTGQKVVYIHDTDSTKEVKTNTKVLHDSVYVDRVREVFMKGDTVFVHDSITKNQYVDIPVIIHDSIIRERTKDVPVEVEKIVKERVRGPLWWIGLIMSAVALLYAAYATFKRFFKK